MFTYTELQLYNWLLVLIPIGILPGVIYSLICIAGDSNGDKTPMYKRRIKNALIFAAVAEASLALLRLIYGYFT